MIECVDVYTQAELDAALKRENVCIHCRGEGYFVLRDSARATLSGSAQATLSGSAQATLYDSARATLSGSAQATLSGSAQATLYDSAQATLSGSAQATLYDSARATLYDSARATARGASQVQLRDQAQVVATDQVAVTDHGPETSVSGGVLISIRRVETAEQWCEFYGVEVLDGDRFGLAGESVAVLFKAVEADWRGSHKTSVSYQPGSTPEAPDWDGGKTECGRGLHFSPRPVSALPFLGRPAPWDEVHYVACPVRLADIVVHAGGNYPEKVKAQRVCAPVWECDVEGQPLVAEAVAQ